MVEDGTWCPAQARMQVCRPHGATTWALVDLLGSALALGSTMCTVALGLAFLFSRPNNTYPVKCTLSLVKYTLSLRHLGTLTHNPSIQF